MSFDVAVVGSVNQDLVVRVPRHPRPGETVLGHDHFTAAGGKGANQAVAASRLGRRVALVGRIGDDAAGRALMTGLTGEGLDVAGVHIDPDAGTGLAVITVDPAGENTIVVSPGANARVTAADVDAAARAVRDAAVVLLQLEVPLEAVARAAATAQGRVILNPAPAHPLEPALLAAVEVLVPNETELGVLVAADPPSDPDEAAAMAAELVGPAAVIVTLGAAGAVVVSAGTATHVPAPTVAAVDATAAGDAFCGGLADAVARGESLEDATRWAVRVGAAATTRLGAQPSLPYPADVPPA